MMEVFTGTLTEIKQAETLLIWDKEVQRRLREKFGGA